MHYARFAIIQKKSTLRHRRQGYSRVLTASCSAVRIIVTNTGNFLRSPITENIIVSLNLLTAVFYRRIHRLHVTAGLYLPLLLHR